MEGDSPPPQNGGSRENFYPRPPGGGRPNIADTIVGQQQISIHALRVEGDLPTEIVEQFMFISIHALRVEGDNAQMHNTSSGGYISIHALRVEGDVERAHDVKERLCISIHALRVEGDKYSVSRVI